MLSKFPNKTLKVGARVSLSPESEFAIGWSRSSANPLGVSGTVVFSEEEICFDRGNDGLRVNWDNGQWNNYRKCDYDLIAEGEPGYLSTE